MKNFFDLGRFKPRANNVLVRDRVRKNVDEELRFPDEKDLFLFVASCEIDTNEFEATAHKLKILSAIEQSNFKSGAAKLESSAEWFRVLPAEWIITEFRPVLERLPVKESIKQSIRQSKKFVKIQISEQFDSTLSCYQILNFATARFAKNVRGVLFEPCSFKLYNHDDWQLKRFDDVENIVPSIAPFLSILTSREGERSRITSHGLSRFNLPELQFENVSQSMSGSCVYLINAIAQSLIEKTVDSRLNNTSALSLLEPLVVSTADVIKGNQGNLPFQSCVPRKTELRLTMRRQNGAVNLFAIFDGNQSEQDSSLGGLLATLSLLRPGDDTMLEHMQTG